MNKSMFWVPKGIRYLSDWDQFKLHDFPYILDKGVTGCGFTEFCIRNNQNIILCSPRKMLLENKEEQHRGEVFYLRNDYDKNLDIDKDLTKKFDKNASKNYGIPEVVPSSEYILGLRQKLRNYIEKCYKEKRKCKILVTYDSYRHVLETLREMGLFEFFNTVVDEFQSIFTDSKFKSTTEMEFVAHLQSIEKVCYVSATPMIDKYLDMLPEFNSLPYYELDWGSLDPGRVVRPNLDVNPCSKITNTVLGIIEQYRNGNFEKAIYQDEDTGELVEIESREAVFYVNSVKNICEIIGKAKMQPHEVNVLCANTSDNKKKVRAALKLRAREEGGIGKVPLEGEPHKMFTFCTRTVYLGADFYSTCAKSYIISDANVDSMVVDITLDLPQILGRQRLTKNPWKNRAVLYVKLLSEKKKVTQEMFNNFLSEKVEHTDSLLRSYVSISQTGTDKDSRYLAESYEELAIAQNYRRNFVAVNKHHGSSLVPVFNNLAMISEMRAFEIQQYDYQDRFRVFSSIEKGGEIKATGQFTKEIEDFLDLFGKYVYFTDRMRHLCDHKFTDQETLKIILEQIPIEYKTYYLSLGPDRIKANGYQRSRLEKEYKLSLVSSIGGGSLKDKVYTVFCVGSRYKLSDIKQSLQEIYNELGLKSTPKATDIEKYFEVRSIQILEKLSGGDYKRIRGYELTKKKDI